MIPIADIASLSKPFERELISTKVRSIIELLNQQHKLSPLISDCKFKIGYVCGNKGYFHPSLDTVKQYGIKQDNLIPCLINSKDISSQRELGLDTEGATSTFSLFYPTNIGSGEKNTCGMARIQKSILGTSVELEIRGISHQALRFLISF